MKFNMACFIYHLFVSFITIYVFYVSSNVFSSCTLIFCTFLHIVHKSMVEIFNLKNGHFVSVLFVLCLHTFYL